MRIVQLQGIFKRNYLRFFFPFFFSPRKVTDASDLVMVDFPLSNTSKTNDSNSF